MPTKTKGIAGGEKVHWMRRPLPRKYEAWKKKVANRIRVEALSQELSWADLAKKAGVTKPTISNFMDYSTRMPHAITIWRLANAVGLELQFPEE